MSTVKPVPHSIEDRLLAARRDRKEVKALLGQAVLQAREEREIKALQEELDLHTAAIERFKAAVEAQAQAVVEQTFEDRKAAVADARATITNRDGEIDKVTAQLLAGINQLAPLAKRLKEAVDERNAALRTGLKAGLDKPSWANVTSSGTVTPLPFVAAALGTALIEAGLPAVGVHIDVASRTDADQLASGIDRVRSQTERLLRKADACLSERTNDDLDEEL